MPATDTKLLPLVLQHVRELIEAQTLSTQKDRYKIITPFPPAFNDFPDFVKDNLDFSDPEGDAAAAARDTWNAYDFFSATDGLFYNYSYGIRSPDQSLSQVCKKFTNDAVFTDIADTNFVKDFDAKRVAFLERFSRSTVGDLGKVDFYYTSPAALQWYSGKIALSEAECKRLKEKALSVYRGIENSDNDYLKSLITEIEVTAYSKIEYDFGFFDVRRAWMDPMLFENNGWKFKTEKEALYAENDPDFNSDDIRLCFAERFYIIKNYAGKPVPSQQAVAIPAHTFVPVAGSIIVHDHRTVVRNNQLQKTLVQVKHFKITSPERAGYVWVHDHWERKKADHSVTPEPIPAIADDSIYKIAAVKCRIIPWKPVSEKQL